MSQLYTRSAIHSVLQSPYSAHYQFDNSYTLRDAAYPGNAVATSDDGQYEGQGWKIRPGLTMSDSRREDYETPRRTEAAPRREQLPSISSLFSASSQPTQSTQSIQQSPPVARPSYVDRSPSYSTTSPQDTRRTGTPSYQDRPFQESYQRQPQVEPAHFSYPSRIEPERSGLPPPPRPIQSAVGSAAESPRSYDPHHSPHESNRTQLSSSSRWSPRSEPGARPDYFAVPLKDSSSAFHASNSQGFSHQPLAPVTRGEPDRLYYRESPAQVSALALPQYPLTPVTNAPSALNQNTTKDALGPKIWTGTQFLPRFVRQQDVPGEGLCYFYDDGTHCKAVIDGEQVNAYWGVTKAGKPRKRLAIACITCREKKIKCDPDYPRCIQCEKFGRVCKFKNAPRGGQGSPETPPADADELSERSHQLEHGRRESQKLDYEPLKYEAATSPSDQHAAKRRKHTYTHFTPLSPGPAHGENTHRRSSEGLILDWNIDPVAAYLPLVQELIPLYFSGLASTSYVFLPSEPMTQWIYSPVPKSLDDLMLIYSMLALASRFSSYPEHQTRGQEFHAIAKYAAEHMPNTLQLCQTRLHLAIYAFTLPTKTNETSEFCARALATASAMKLNIEVPASQISPEKIPYGLNIRGYQECTRRTFWSCYIMDRFNGFYNNHLSFINPDDIFLRLPLSDASFKAQLPNDNPYFTFDMQPSVTEMGAMGYLIGISSIWGDVMANIYRCSNRPSELPKPDPAIQRDFYDKATSKLQAWRYSLPAHLQPSESNFATIGTTFGTWMTMHTLYHATQIQLNRYIRAVSVPTATIERNIAQAISSAREVLRLITHPSILANPEFSTPLASYLVSSAVDILSSRGSLSHHKELFESFKPAVRILEKLSHYWAPAATQLSVVQKRVDDFEEVGRGAPGGKWEFKDRIEKSVSREFDAVYEVPFDVWERAVAR